MTNHPQSPRRLMDLTAADLSGLTTEELADAWHASCGTFNGLWTAHFKRVLTAAEKSEKHHAYEMRCAIEREQGRRRHIPNIEATAASISDTAKDLENDWADHSKRQTDQIKELGDELMGKK